MKITLDSFLAVLNKSGLLPQEKLSSLLATFQSKHSGPAEGQPFAEFLIAQNAITPWQAEKLLLGKHKGFFLGKYRLLALLGKGGMSSVYLAEHVLMRRRCAIKVLPAKKVNDTSYLGRFHREAQAVAALDHPNIVRAYDVDHEQDGNVEIHFLVMEYVDGQSLLDLVNRDGPQSPAAAAEYIRQAALGLEHAHRAGLIHRDVKPGNLLVDSNGVVKVMDLGLARFFTGEEEGGESLTIQYDEKVLGTADYLAPEQAVDSHDIDSRADLYSLGCTLYFLLVGHPPFNTGTLPQRLMAHQAKEPPPVDAERNDVPASLLAIMKKMMSKRPGDRFASAAGVAEACLEWLQEYGGEVWEEMRNKLAESGIDAGVSTTRTGSSSVRIPQVKAAELAKASIAASDTTVQATAASAPVKPTPVKPAPRPATPAAASPPKPPPKPAPASVAQREDELGAFLANLSDSDSGPERTTAPSAPVIRNDSTVRPSGKKGSPKPAVPPAARPTPPAAAKPTPPAAAKPTPPVARPTTPAPVARPVEEVPVAEATIVEAIDAEPVTEAEAVAEPVGTVVAAKRPMPWSQIPRQYLIYGGAAAGVLIAVIGLILAQSGGGDTPSKPVAVGAPTTPDGGAAGGPAPGTAPAVSPKPKRPEPTGPQEVTVGPEGNFATIGEALQYSADNPPLTDPTEQRVIKVTGGETYSERLSIQNWNFGSLHILSTGDKPAILKPDGQEPVITIDTSSKVRIEGLQIDATGKPVAIQLTGSQNGVTLHKLKIHGFKQTGIAGDSAGGFRSGRLELRELTLQSPAATAGIRLAAPSAAVYSGVQFVTVAGCRLIGSYVTGLEMTGPQSDYTIQKNAFHNVKTAMRLGVGGIELSQVMIENNTFHHVSQGLLLDQPPKSTANVTVQKNLFADLSGPEVALEASGDAAAFDAWKTGAKAQFNATDRTADAVKGNAWDLFASNGKTDIKADFASTDPAAADFLKPKNKGLKMSAAPGPDKFIGALSP
ncbi:MAG: protein kinase domain-containing protein [Planctomycetaceae bacterium]